MSIKKAKEEVCQSNRMEIGQSYRMQLQINGIKHNEMAFSTYLLEIEGTPCPENGKLVYEDGVVLCNIHSQGYDSDDKEKTDEVPNL